jgi:hypothetical protein
MKKFLPYDLKIKRLNKSYMLNDEEDNDDDDKSDTEDDTVVDSVDTLPNDIFTQYWDVLEEEQDETYSSILYISQMIININCPSKVVSRHHVLSYVNLTLNVRHIMILYKEGTYLKPVSSSWLQVHKL